MWLAARWRKRRRRGPKLMAVTVDHGLRPAARREAADVKRLAKRLGIAHRTVRWTGKKPPTGLQEKARAARYQLIAAAAARACATCVLTAHTVDDQAETILFRLARGSGLAGLAGMARVRPLVMPATGVFLVRPLLELPKSRLIATLRAAGVAAADDPSNHDPRFARTRLRALMPALAREGLDAPSFARLARRARRVDTAIEFAVAAAAETLTAGPWPERGPIMLPARGFAALPAEVALRLLGRAIDWIGDEGPVELGKLEALFAALALASAGQERLRRTLAGAVVSLGDGRIAVERAPPRRQRGSLPKSLSKSSSKSPPKPSPKRQKSPNFM
jgi:tRNA(Ile)-lysidine synthase